MDPGQELVNVYDDKARVVDVWPRRQAKASGRAVGAVNALVLNRSGEVLLQLRHLDKENGGLWDKSVGGHVSAGEDFDCALVREASEELFSVAASPHVRLAASEQAFATLLTTADLGQDVVLRRVAFQRNLRDVRHAPGGGVRNVVYHLAIYLGRTELRVTELRPQVEEIGSLSYFPAEEVDRMLLRGALAPNMGFLWLAFGKALLSLVSARVGPLIPLDSPRTRMTPWGLERGTRSRPHFAPTLPRACPRASPATPRSRWSSGMERTGSSCS